MTVTRRQFIERAMAASVGFAGLRVGLARGASLGALLADAGAGYGPLLPDPNKLLDLPAGFSYTVVSRAGQEMDDGLLVPGQHDGMAAFARPDGTTAIVCNHEIEMPAHRARTALGPDDARFDRVKPGLFYDPGRLARGGTTTTIYDTRKRQVSRRFMSLHGTVRNCAGGPTPWGSWLTCEETNDLRGSAMPGGFEQDHGYVFEVPSALDHPVEDPKPLRALGRFRHEAVCVDPRTGIVYLTEDMADGAIYRFIPLKPGELSRGGRLQALASKVRASLCTRNWADSPMKIPVGAKLPVRWIDLDDVEAPKDDLRLRAFAAGAARFARAEGMWFGHDRRTPGGGGEVFWACTTGGSAGVGQIWRYSPGAHEGQSGEVDAPGTLELFIEPNDSKVIANADNLCVSPWGGLFVCEDSGLEVQRLIGVAPSGGCFPFAATTLSELAGVHASPDGRALFVNIQRPGTMLAIHGPFRSLNA